MDEGEDNGEYNLEMDLDGENESVESDMKPCFIIAETSLDLSEFSAAIIEALRAEKERGFTVKEKKKQE